MNCSPSSEILGLPEEFLSRPFSYKSEEQSRNGENLDNSEGFLSPSIAIEKGKR